MGLSFNTLVNAALMGGANYGEGRRIRKDTKMKAAIDADARARAEELRQSALAENKSQASAADALALQRRDQMEHPEKYRSAGNQPEYEAKTSYYDAQIAAGKSPAEANAAVRLRFGGTPDRPQAPVRGTPEYLAAVDAEESVRDRHQSGRSSDTGEAGSAKALTDRREFYQSRITHWVDMGYDIDEARAKADAEFTAASSASGPFSDVKSSGISSSGSNTAKLLQRTIPAQGANAGKSGVKPTVTSSTPRQDPTSATSPKAGTLRPASDAEIDAAIDAVGSDPKKIKKYLADKGLTG